MIIAGRAPSISHGNALNRKRIERWLRGLHASDTRPAVDSPGNPAREPPPPKGGRSLPNRSFCQCRLNASAPAVVFNSYSLGTGALPPSSAPAPDHRVRKTALGLSGTLCKWRDLRVRSRRLRTGEDHDHDTTICERRDWAGAGRPGLA